MPGGCWVCNPLCGKCQPAPKKACTCPECGSCTIFDKKEIIAGAVLRCRSCGHDVTDAVRPITVLCGYSNLICAYPCGKSTSSESGLGYRPCKRNTPPSGTEA